MPTTPRPLSLPERPSPQQLKKRAKDLQRAVRSQSPTALALVARHALESLEDPAGFTLDTAQLVIARLYGFLSWPRLREHLTALPGTPGDRRRTGTRTVEDFYRLRTGWADASDVRRCAAASTGAHPDPAQWLPLLTVRYNGVKVIAFDSPAGAVFAELTPKRVTLSSPAGEAPSAGEGASVTFHSEFGTIAGVVAPDVTGLAVELAADRRPLGWTLVADGVFVAPNAFLVGPAGLVLRINHSPRGEVVPAAALPPRSAAVVDRPAPATEATARLVAALAAADAPPVVDPEQWRPGVHADLTPTEQVRLGRYGKLLVWHRTGGRESVEDPFVFDFTPQQGPVQDFAVVGKSIAFTRMYYDFVDGASGTIAVVGLVDDADIASVVLRRDNMPDLPAQIAGGTFLIAGPDLTDLTERGPATAVLVSRDHAGNVREELLYQEQH
ncbi:hypothetical protein [Streptomyces aurantiacus]|uniref:hypothetical protein n=1 Tax=Streptomyces aurantiacus TaxID=47760 RepID=UPI0006E3EC4B|nr:hypothetical protein [Streptomyces aurantiacus]